MTEMKESVKRIDDFYSNDVVFEGSVARCTWERGMDVGSDAGESQQAEVVEDSKTNASVSRWGSDSKSDSSTVFATYSAAQKAARSPSVLNGETCAVEASMHSSSFPTLLASLPKTRFQTSNSFQSTWSIPSPSASPSLDSLPVTADDPGATFATKRLTINTDNRTTTSTAIASPCGPMHRYQCTPSRKPPQSSYPVCTPLRRPSKTPVHEYARRDAEETHNEMRDDLVDSPFIRVDSTAQSSSSDRESHSPRSSMRYPGSVNPRQWSTASRGLPRTG